MIFLLCILDHKKYTLYRVFQIDVQSGREISVILLTVVGDGWKDKKIMYNTGSKIDSFLRKKVFLVLFCSRRAAYIVRDKARKFTSVGLSYKDVILFSKIFYVFDVIYVKIN